MPTPCICAKTSSRERCDMIRHQRIAIKRVKVCMLEVILMSVLVAEAL